MRPIDPAASIEADVQPRVAAPQMRRIVSGSCAALGLCLAALGTTSGGSPNAQGVLQRLKADVYYLASDTLEGRAASTPGGDLAARHIRAEFRRLGLRSGPPDGSYYQPFEYRRAPDAPRSTTRNVIGVLEGEGDLAGQAIVIGAHYDHLGRGESGSLAPEALRGRIHPGADDNASGIAAMLELARRFASHATPPARRLVFVAFGGEEDGLIGSRHYVSRDPTCPIGDTVAMVNFDMVGRLRENELGVAGDRSAGEFARLLAEADVRSPLNLRLGGADYPEDSDHAPFASAGVPFLYICTGSHPDRHTPSDTADRVDFEGMAEVVSFCEDLLGRLLVSPRPTFSSARRDPPPMPK
jgi:aminopeptidase N